MDRNCCIINVKHFFRSLKAKVDTGLGGRSLNKIKHDVAPLPKGTGIQAVTQIAVSNKKDVEKKMKIIQVKN